MSHGKTVLASLLLITAGAAYAQDVPNPFLAPVQAPPPLQGVPPNGNPPPPEPIQEEMPSIFRPYPLSPVVVEPVHQELNVVPVSTFVFTPTPLLPPAPPEAAPAVLAQAEAHEATPEVTPPVHAEETADTPPALNSEELAEPTEPAPSAPQEANPEPATTAPAETPATAAAAAADAAAGAAAVPAAQPSNDLLILGITTGVQPTAMIRVGGTLGIYRSGDELPNGFTINEIEPLAVTFTLPKEEEPDDETETSDPTEDEQTEEAREEDDDEPITLRVNIQ